MNLVDTNEIEAISPLEKVVNINSCTLNMEGVKEVVPCFLKNLKI